MRNNTCIKKAAAFLAAALLLSSCAQENNSVISETSTALGEVSLTEASEATYTTAMMETDFTVELETPPVVTEAAAETTSVTEPDDFLTPLERAYQYIEGKSNCLLYDFTGDDFPEVLEVSFDALEGRWYEYCIYDIVNDYILTLDLSGDTLYICKDDTHKYFVTGYTWSADSFQRWEAERTDFFENEVSQRKLGYIEMYYGYYTDRFYNPTLYIWGNSFEGCEQENIEYSTYSWEIFDKISDEIFPERFNEYLSGCNIIGKINVTTNDDGNICLETDLTSGDFAEYPSDIYKDFRDYYYDKTDSNWFTRGTYYYSDGVYVSDSGEFMVLYLDDIPEDFDFDTLKAFENVRKLHIEGRADDLEFVKNMPEIRVVEIHNFRLTEADKELLRPLTELPELGVISDSGMGSCLDAFSDEEWDEIVHDMFGKYLWVFKK